MTEKLDSVLIDIMKGNSVKPVLCSLCSTGKGEYEINDVMICSHCFYLYSRCSHEVFLCDCRQNTACSEKNCNNSRLIPKNFCSNHMHTCKFSDKDGNVCMKRAPGSYDKNVYYKYKQLLNFKGVLYMPPELCLTILDFMILNNGCEKHRKITKCINCERQTSSFENYYCKKHSYNEICGFPINKPSIQFIDKVHDEKEIIRCDTMCFRSYSKGSGCFAHNALKKCISCPSLNGKYYLEGNYHCESCKLKLKPCSDNSILNISKNKYIIRCPNITFTPMHFFVDENQILSSSGGCENCKNIYIRGLRGQTDLCIRCGSETLIIIDTYFLGRKYKINNGNPIICKSCISK